MIEELVDPIHVQISNLQRENKLLKDALRQMAFSLQAWTGHIPVRDEKHIDWLCDHYLKEAEKTE